MSHRIERRMNPLLVPLFVAVLGLNACADGGAIVASGTTGCGTQLTTAAGIWIGSGSFIGGGTTVGMISGGNLIVLQVTGENPLNAPFVSRYYVGEYDPSTLAGTARVYNQFGRLLAANQELRIAVGGTLNVTVGAATTLMPMCPLTDGTGAPVYNRPSVIQDAVSELPVNLITGIWQFEEATQTGTYTLTYTMSATGPTNGGIDGNDTPGCFYIGEWRDPDPQRNLYRFEEMSLSSQVTGACDTEDPEAGPVNFDGDGYHGFAFILDPDPNEARFIWTVVSNGQAAYFIRFNRTSPPPNLPPNNDDDLDF